jgi:hypothetical protein
MPQFSDFNHTSKLIRAVVDNQRHINDPFFPEKWENSVDPLQNEKGLVSNNWNHVSLQINTCPRSTNEYMLSFLIIYFSRDLNLGALSI